MDNRVLNPYFMSLCEAYTLVCKKVINFPMPWWAYLLPFTKTWAAWEQLNRIADYLYDQFKKEEWFV